MQVQEVISLLCAVTDDGKCDTEADAILEE